jgi:Carbohydrate esterase, sialic acid-specific acetylesterase
MKQIYKCLAVLVLVSAQLQSFSQDKKFYIFLCLGQSNMEGYARIQPQDTVNVDPRFRVMQAVNCPDLQRTKNNWYTAVPPLSRCRTGLTPADYFGRTMLANLPADVRIGIINVSVGGCKIELFDRDNYQTYTATAPNWMMGALKEYDGNPYGHLVEMAKLAQKDGIIKGILLHQGESNIGDSTWPQKVSKVYANLLNDLSLNAQQVPLLAGEVVHADQGGVCASMNPIINQLPQFIPTAHVISSKGCADSPDNLHFNAEGYREFGKRYAEKMLALLGIRSTK